MTTKIKNFGTIALFVAFSFITTATLANNGKGEKPAVELKFIGNVKNNPVFQLDLTGATEQLISIAIKDVYGNTLYSERVKAKDLSRKYQLDSEQIDDDILKVEVRSEDSNKPQVFTINRSTRYVNETNITKL